MKKLGEDETPSTLLMKISNIRVESKENTKGFNYIFLTLLNRVPTTSLDNDVGLMEFYTKSLPHPFPMWFKMVRK